MTDIPKVEGHEVRFFYTLDTPHQWSTGVSIHTTDPEDGGYIKTIERARELADQKRIGKWGDERHVETTYGIFFRKKESE